VIGFVFLPFVANTSYFFPQSLTLYATRESEFLAQLLSYVLLRCLVILLLPTVSHKGD